MTRVESDHDVAVHRALGSRVRTRLLEVLRDEPDLDARALADRLGLHVNTVRAHLGVLEDAGLVCARVEERDRPGRPRLLYRSEEPSREDASPSPDRGYRLLAGMLASYLAAQLPDGPAAAEEAGTAWGRYLVDTPPPFRELTPSDGIARLVRLLDELGFAPRREDTDPGAPRIVLGRCPFLDVAREHQEIVCSLHLGLMRGALQGLGVAVTATDLRPWARPHGCVGHLRVA